MQATHPSRLARLLLLALFAGLAPARAAHGQEAPLVWRGCGITEKAFMGACAKAFEKETGQAITVSAAGATLGIRSTAGRSADLGGTCRPCQPDSEESERGVETAIVAWDALVAVTHASNPIGTLTKGQVGQIFRGEVTNWSEVGGPDLRVILVGRKTDESGVGVMAQLMIHEDLQYEYPKDSILLRSSGPVEDFVEKTPGTIAITGVSSAVKRKFKILRIDDVAPDVANISSGRYPYFRPLYMVYRADGDPRAIEFIKWIQGESAQAVIAAEGTVNLTMGLPLVQKFQHWPDVSTLSNYADLLARARAAEAALAGR